MTATNWVQFFFPKWFQVKVPLKSLALCLRLSSINDSNIERVKKYRFENLLPAQYSVTIKN